MGWRSKMFAVVGDSQSDYRMGYCQGFEQWAFILEGYLRQAGIDAGNRVFGKSGDTSTLALARVDELLLCETPSMAFIEIGVNDPGASIAQATTQANIETTILALKHGATGPGPGNGGPLFVATPSALPATGKEGQRYVVQSDNDTTGGAAAIAGTTQTATITGTLGGSPQSVWEFRYPQAGAKGWGRVATVATAPTAVKRIGVISAPFLNFASGGDSLATPFASYVNVRAAQQAAVTAENVAVGGAPSVIYVDLYTFLRNRIVAGIDPEAATAGYTQASSWHVANGNQHLNAYGHVLVAQSTLAAIIAAGWPAVL